MIIIDVCASIRSACVAKGFVGNGFFGVVFLFGEPLVFLPLTLVVGLFGVWWCLVVSDVPSVGAFFFFACVCNHFFPITMAIIMSLTFLISPLVDWKVDELFSDGNIVLHPYYPLDQLQWSVLGCPSLPDTNQLPLWKGDLEPENRCTTFESDYSTGN